MSSNPQNQMIGLALQKLGGFRQLAQENLRQIDEFERILKNGIVGPSTQKCSKQQVDEQVIIGIAYGRRLSGEEFNKINEDDYHIILDLTTNQLRYRKDPAKRSPLIVACPDGIGPDRIQYLIHLLEHPKSHISIDTRLPGQGPDHISEPNTLSKTISILRRFIGQTKPAGPYLLMEKLWGQKYCQYKLNPEWNYLVKKYGSVSDKSSPDPS